MKKKSFIASLFTVLAQSKDNIFGEVGLPPGLAKYGSLTGGSGGGLTGFISAILKTLIVVAGVYAVFNIILAGYGFMSAGDDPKKMQGAWAKIWQTMLGLTFAAGAFVLAAIFGKLIFNDYNALLKIKLFGPGQ